MPCQVKRLSDAIMQAQDAYENAQMHANASHAAYRDALSKGDDETAQKHAQDVDRAEARAFSEAYRIEQLKGQLKEAGYADLPAAHLAIDARNKLD